MDRREQDRYQDPLYHEKFMKRRMNKKIREVRKQIEDLALEIGSYSRELEDLISTSEKLDEEIKQLQEKN